MPRFLNTWTGNFEWHNNPAEVCYTILSHTWRDPIDGGEQTYTDILKLQAELVEYQKGERVIALTPPAPIASGTQSFPSSKLARDAPMVGSDSGGRRPSPFLYHPQLSEKIAMACKVAREAGYKLLWIDTCCIDKSSSAELAEAINSMYKWYRLSNVCYAFLANVPDDEDPAGNQSQFRQSRWHGRGWTLQELIAPERVLFLTKTWTFLGMKRGLATTIKNISGIDFDIVVGRAPISSVSVARRMLWAAERKTTRVEDRAYSLLGLFGIHMAPI